YGAGGSSTPAGKTVGRCLKERREKKKEETKAHNAQLHASVSVAGVAAAVATIVAATAAASALRKDEQMAKTDMAVPQLPPWLWPSVSRLQRLWELNANISLLLLILLLTSSPMAARALKEVWNIAAVIPLDKGVKVNKNNGKSNGYREDILPEENFLRMSNQELLDQGSELRTCNGDLHWKIVSVYIHRTGEVMLKMKSKHAWPGRHLFDGGEQRRYFGLRTSIRGVVEFGCQSQREYDMWTQDVLRLLLIVAEKKLARLP
nr:FORKED 1 [Tanacetum cinerariifolium]